MVALHHFALGSADPVALAKFYRDLADLPEIRRWHHDDSSVRSVWLRLGEAVLMIERTDASRPQVEGVGAGLFLLAFRIDASERETWLERLAQLGALVESQTTHSVYFRDPDGNRVALSSYPLED